MTITMDRTTLRQLQTRLRSLGFRRTDRGRSTNNPDCQIYERGNVSEFALTVQLWGDGKHRVAHWCGGVQRVKPTEFEDLEGMHAAIKEQEEYRP